MRNSPLKKSFLTAHAGLLLLALPIPLLLIPSRTPTGGVPGLATLLFFLHGWPPGLSIFLLNSVALSLAVLLLGRKGFWPSLYASFVLSFLVEGIHRLLDLPTITFSFWPWLMQAFASLVMGGGLCLTVKSGYTPAGVALLSLILHRFTKLPVLFWLILFDATLAMATAFWMDPVTGLRTAFGTALMYFAYGWMEKKFKTG